MLKLRSKALVMLIIPEVVGLTLNPRRLTPSVLLSYRDLSYRDSSVLCNREAEQEEIIFFSLLLHLCNNPPKTVINCDPKRHKWGLLTVDSEIAGWQAYPLPNLSPQEHRAWFTISKR